MLLAAHGSVVHDPAVNGSAVNALVSAASVSVAWHSDDASVLWVLDCFHCGKPRILISTTMALAMVVLFSTLREACPPSS